MRSDRDSRLFAALALVTLVAGHNLVFLATFGLPRYQRALASTGHGLAWTLAVVSTATIATTLAGLAVARLWRLADRARRLGGRSSRQTNLFAAHGRGFGRWWLALFVVGLAAFAVVENVERLAAGQSLPGLAAVVGSTLSPIVVFAVVSGVVAFVAALYVWGAARLLARIGTGQQRWDRAARPAVPRPRAIDCRPESPIGQRVAGRAPPGIELAPPLLA